MAFQITKYLPFLGVKHSEVAEPLTSDPTIFALQYSRGPIPKERDGAENYFISSRQYPRYSLSGPTPTIGRPFHIAMPAFANAQRQFPNASINAANIVNGQVYSQPLYDTQAGGFTRAFDGPNNNAFVRFRFGQAMVGGGAA